MKKLHHFLATVLLLAHVSAGAQTAIAIGASTTFAVRSGTPFYIDGLVMTPSSHFTFNAPNNLVRNTTITNTIAGAYISRVYKWNNTLPAFSGTITVNYLDAELNSIPEADLTLNAYTGSSWSSYITGVTRDGINNSVATAGISNITLQELTLASVLEPLPVQWGPVKAWRKGNLAYVAWSVSNESDISYYEIQKSTNGVNWQTLPARMPAVNATTHHYIQADSGIAAVRTIYRIQQVSHDNRLGLSPMVTIEALTDGFTARIFPNPVSNQLTVRSGSAQTIQSITIYTTDGKWLLNRSVNKPEYQLDVSAWLPGVYLLQVTGADGKISHHTLIKK